MGTMFNKNWIWVSCAAALAIGCSKSDDTGTSEAPTAHATTGGKPAPASAGYGAVQTILTKNCTACHGAANAKGGINLASYDAVMKGGDDGAIVVAGDPDKSKLIDALRGRNGAMKMPKGVPAGLPETDIKAIEDWIKAGAKQS